MKSLFLLAALILSAASINLYAQDPSNPLSLTGFSEKKDLDLESDTFNFRDEKTYKFSKAKFKSKVEAEEFCKKKQMQLADDVSILVVAMAGGTQNKKIKEAILFDLKLEGQKISGVVGWSQGEKSDLFLMRDGSGTDSNIVSYDEFESLHKKAEKPLQGLSAVCTLDIKGNGAVVDDGRSERQDKGSPSTTQPKKETSASQR
ncbi:MAG: hypothetical protein K2P81_00130 [Bacteriovoracaceae bacterium]|nr:hypothetical protein [Bacteriovoracaceae bacterium]